MDQYTLASLDVAAALVATGHEPLGVAHIDDQTRFAFATGDKLLDTIVKYHTCQLPVDARTLIATVRSLEAAEFTPEGLT